MKPRYMPAWYEDLAIGRSAKSWIDGRAGTPNVIIQRSEARTTMGRRLDDWRLGTWRGKWRDRELEKLLNKLSKRK